MSTADRTGHRASVRRIEAVDIGGPGLVTSGGMFTGRRFAAIVALEGLATAAVLNSLTIRTTVKTVIRVQAADAELFLLDTEQTPQDLRIYLSRPLAEIRAAREAAAGPPPGPAAAQGQPPPRPLTRSGRAAAESLEVMAAAADRVPEAAEQGQDDADQEHDDADGPHNGDVGEEPDEQKDETENNHVRLLRAS